MKKYLIAAFLLALALITIGKVRSYRSERTASAGEETKKQQLVDFWAAYNEGSAQRTAGNVAAAVDAYRRALAINPRHEDSVYYLSTSLAQLGNYPEAVAALRQLIAINPESQRAHAQLGNLLSAPLPGAPHDLAQARREYERTLEINREQAGGMVQIGKMELNEGRFAEAERQFLAGEMSGSTDARFYAGYTFFVEGKRAEAERHFSRILDAYWADRKIIAKGVLSEGDIIPAAGKPLSALETAALKSIVLLYWTEIQQGRSPAQAAAAAHVRFPEPGTSSLRAVPGAVAGGGQGAWADFARDGRPGLAVGGQTFALYRRIAGRLVEVTPAAGLANIHDIWRAYWADVDGDGYPELYLIRGGFTGAGQNLLFRNNRNGTFTDVTRAMGLDSVRSTISVCFADFSGGHRLDLVEVGASSGGRATVRLYRNVDGRFREQEPLPGAARAGAAVDCAVADYDLDGKPDLFVQYWRQDAVLYRNLGQGQFAEVTQKAGVAGLHAESFSSIFLDYDKDGAPDLLVTTHAPLEDVARSLLQGSSPAGAATPRLFHNNRNGTFSEVTAAAGLNRSYGIMQALAADFDGDGWPDLLFVNGGSDAQQLQPSVILRNHGGRFQPWAYVPGFVPTSFVGGAAVSDGKATEVYLAPHPVLRRQSPGGVFTSSPR